MDGSSKGRLTRCHSDGAWRTKWRSSSTARHSQRRYRSQDTISHKEAQVTFEVLVTVKDSKGCYHRNRLVSLAYAVNE
ncbi:MAG: hypothetical protein QGG39_06690 [Candidatus Poribacteria bacterium]|nr:hypothetical protein [Candidatus Poribacteria bacterium]MDP7279556.1 hypothetical protein [Candidatus Poribacteria bacterium]